MSDEDICAIMHIFLEAPTLLSAAYLPARRATVNPLAELRAD